MKGERKIFVSVGTHSQQFDRLLAEMDRLKGRGKAKASVFAQTGNSDYVPANFPSKKFLDAREYRQRMEEASIVVSHGGAGTIINALRMGKKVVVVPRLKSFGEHTNDHQLDLAEALEREEKAIAVKEIRELEKALEKAAGFKPKTASTRERLASRVKGAIGSA